MVLLKTKISFTIVLLAGVYAANAQQTNVGNNFNNGNLINQAVTNINYNPVQVVANNDNNASEVQYLNNNVANNPPAQQVQIQQQETQQQVQSTNQTIVPSLGNGFHVRFQLNSSSADKSFAGSSAKSSFSKAKKSKNNYSKFSFRMKHKMKNMFSKHKKAYNTSLCSRF